ncbi:phenylpropionate dioxygenase-like ring-hydroxylating dioxygenase large terminal subunit [Mycobacterium frederiksbergense]|uniref:Phenylpropionate dioxygenase-like ring-hydroxylating dioxygenase large terminal subunit n=1 Tax=Mycolicibacterium frederiksbergense TaxID=117567 RepID=A0ABT6KZE0_9MYCO|nr:Rieske 2Fe-2S domain-containing protein [Mycolicibacterium frederiksbergense]MDH6196061.1 phenylpropionate dioxygenase-like ring-hydroxylating dioxygenase large terminal subunit [Mycolicibacterium frederiksbergense]
MLLKDHWYPACPSSKLTADAPTPFQVWDQHYVAFRDESGEPRILVDRCLHRGVPLSLGRVHDGVLSCGYHGWDYDGTGKVVHIPSLTRPLKVTYCVTAMHTREVDHYVWVWIPGEHESPTYEPAVLGVEDHGWIQQTKIWNSPIMAAVENQLDVAHTPFSHPGIYPGHKTEKGELPELQTRFGEVRAHDRSVTYWGPPSEETEPVPHWSEVAAWAQFDLPYRNYVFLTREGTYAIYHWVPLTETSCRLEFMGRSRLPNGDIAPPSGVVLFLEDELELLSQDRVLLEGAAERNRSGGQVERSVVADLPPQLARRLVDNELKGKAYDETGLADRQRTFEFRS